jgi:hypothetical protein
LPVPFISISNQSHISRLLPSLTHSHPNSLSHLVVIRHLAAASAVSCRLAPALDRSFAKLTFPVRPTHAALLSILLTFLFVCSTKTIIIIIIIIISTCSFILRLTYAPTSNPTIIVLLPKSLQSISLSLSLSLSLPVQTQTFNFHHQFNFCIHSTVRLRGHVCLCCFRITFDRSRLTEFRSSVQFRHFAARLRAVSSRIVRRPQFNQSTLDSPKSRPKTHLKLRLPNAVDCSPSCSPLLSSSVQYSSLSLSLPGPPPSPRNLRTCRSFTCTRSIGRFRSHSGAVTVRL